MITFEDRLEAGLLRMAQGDRPDEIAIETMVDSPESLQALLETAAMLEQLPDPLPQPAWQQQADRQTFLASVDSLLLQTPSADRRQPRRTWYAVTTARLLGPVAALKQRMAAKPMYMLAARITLILMVAVAALTGVTAASAPSLPDSPLYPVKLAREQVRLAITGDPAEAARLRWQMAVERAEEARLMSQAGQPPGSGMLARLEEQLQAALDASAQLPDETMPNILGQARERLLQEEAQLARLRAQSDPQIGQVDELLTRTRLRLELGLEDSQAFRWQHTHGWPDQEPGDGAGPGPMDELSREQRREEEQQGACLAGQECGPFDEQDQIQQHPQQQDCDDCEPEGDQNRFGPAPDQPGDGTCEGCQQEQNQQGQDQEPPGQGGPGGGDNCPDCEPNGDENQNGQDAQPPGNDNQGGQGDNGSPEGDPGGNQNGNDGSGGTDSGDANSGGNQNEGGGGGQTSGTGGGGSGKP